MTRRAAVIGAGGLVGGAVAASLRRAGWEVATPGRAPGAGPRADLSVPAIDPGALKGCELLAHCAGITNEELAAPEAAWRKAVHGTRALLQAAAQAGVSRVAYVSSAHVYGPLEGRIDESRAPDPRGDYALAHFVAEQMFREHVLASASHGLVLRPCAVYGMPPSLERFARWSLVPFDFPRQALGGRIVLRTPGTQRRNFVAADALGEAMAAWADGDAEPFAVRNAVGPADLSVAALAELTARLAHEATGRDCAVERPPGAVPGADLEYRSRHGGVLRGLPLEDHLRAMLRALRTGARP